MWEHDCGCLPVVDDNGDVVGMITDRDACIAAYTRGLALSAVSVGSAMSKSLYSCTPDAKISEIERLMRLHQVRRLPVVDVFGTLVGIVTVSDLARAVSTRRVAGIVSASGVAKTIADICAHRQPAAA
jgi:CBS domain-containing protein